MSGEKDRTRQAITEQARRERESLRRNGRPAPSQAHLEETYRRAIVRHETRKERDGR